jgi:hypothetical protein
VKDYKYPHDYAGLIVVEEYHLENLKGKVYCQPSYQGFEREVKRRLEQWRKKKGEKARPPSSPLKRKRKKFIEEAEIFPCKGRANHYAG